MVARLGVHKYRPLGMTAQAAVAGMFENVLNIRSEQEVVIAAHKSGAIPSTLPGGKRQPRGSSNQDPTEAPAPRRTLTSGP